MSPADNEHEPQLTTEDDLQAIFIQKVIPHNGPVTRADHNPQWPALFTREAARIRAVLGAAAVQVEHVGSTSVPGLAAKPVIDILLAVPDSADEQASWQASRTALGATVVRPAGHPRAGSSLCGCVVQPDQQSPGWARQYEQ
jgi:GrpB-like predicted nucleotidyltransferase (UPF0157 family)